MWFPNRSTSGGQSDGGSAAAMAVAGGLDMVVLEVSPLLMAAHEAKEVQERQLYH